MVGNAGGEKLNRPYYYVSEFDKRGIIARTKFFSLCIPSESALNKLQHNVRCASIAATIPEIRADSYPHVVNIIIEKTASKRWTFG